MRILLFFRVGKESFFYKEWNNFLILKIIFYYIYQRGYDFGTVYLSVFFYKITQYDVRRFS